MSLFEQASREKLRFGTPAGVLTPEDLWDIPLTSQTGKANLDDIAKHLNRKISADDESFVDKPAKKDSTAQLAFELVKRVIAVRLEENEAARNAKAKKEEKAKILAIIARKQDQALEEESVEDLMKRIEEL